MDARTILITYADSMGQNIRELGDALARHFQGAITGVHLLPFFPSSADRGFAPITYREVDPAFGSWEDVRALGERYALMADFMINHLSAHSPQYLDFLARRDDSPWSGLFLRYRDLWPGGEPSRDELDRVYKRKERDPYVLAEFADGAREKVWCTFDAEQIDLNCRSDAGRAFIRENLEFLARQGVTCVRLDAFAYAVKRAGGSCFFEEPGVWELLRECADILAPLGAGVLPEIHEHYTIQQKIAEKGYPVYDFALPMLLLHALYFGEARYLKHWLTICPRNQFTTLDTHDGIGVVDVKDLLPDAEIERAKEHLFTYGANVKRSYNTAAYHNLDVYQVNCTYYSALGEDDAKYLLARAVQIFAPGVPMIYYVGLLAGRNDIELLEKTKVGRNINRHAYTLDEIARETERPVVQKLLRLLRLRNDCPAFGGSFSLAPTEEPWRLRLRWRNGAHTAELDADLRAAAFAIRCEGPDGAYDPLR